MLIRKLISHFRLFAILPLGFLLVACDDGSGPEKIVDEQPKAAVMELVWSDEFDVDGAPDVRNWTMETGYGDNGWGNQEWQLYTNDTSSENNNVRVEGGNLIITARCSRAETEPAERVRGERAQTGRQHSG